MNGMLEEDQRKVMEQVGRYLSGEKIGIEKWLQD
jgi:hypothetical protein